MSGITDLSFLLKNMNPILNDGEFVFCTIAINELKDFAELDPVSITREAEGWSLIIPREKAELKKLEPSSVFKMITLSVHSSLQAVGFLAFVLGVLADQEISVNAVSAFYHDYLFVPADQVDDAIKLLNVISSDYQN
jgi:uncharacterized protein